MIWLAHALISFLATLLSYLIAPIIVPFAATRLPKAFRWMETYDNDLDGDNGWKTEHFVGWPRYIKRVLWLWRNPVGTLDYWLGATVDKPRVWGDPKTSNRPGHSGLCFARSGRFWMLYYVRQWGESKRCLRIYLGWKLMSAVHGNRGRFPLVYSINPLMGFDSARRHHPA